MFTWYTSIRIHVASIYVCTSNSMGDGEIWDEYHKCCIENGKDFMVQNQVKFSFSM